MAGVSGLDVGGVIVTRLSDNSRVANAVVTLYVVQYNYPKDPEVVVLTSGVTDEQGVARLAKVQSQNYGSQYVVVQAGNELLVHAGSIGFGYKNTFAQTRVVATTDRNLYKEGDIVHVAGYVRRFDDAFKLLPGISCVFSSSFVSRFHF